MKTPRNSCDRTQLTCVALCLLLAIQALAFHKGESLPLPNLDKRQRAERPQAPPDRAAALARLRAQAPGVTVDWDAVVSSPRHVSASGGFLTGPDGQGRAVPAQAAAGFGAQDPDRAVKAFLHEHQALFGHGAGTLGAARKAREFTTPHNGLRTVVWEQQVDELPVFEATLVAHTTRRGELVNLSSQFVPDVAGAARRGAPNQAALRREPPVPAARAVALAAQDVEPDAAAEVSAVDEAAAGPEQRRRFRGPALKGEAEVKLIWLPMNANELRLCWDVLFTSRSRQEMFRALVDVQTGEVLVRRSLTEYISNATYRVYPSDSPSPFSPGHPTPLTTQPPVVPRVLITTNAFNTNASPNGWINDGDNETRGNNVDAHLDRNDDDSPDLPRPQGTPARVFDFPLDLALAPSTYGNAAVVQLFYLNNRIHDELYGLGFTEAAGNFQVNNFGRGGLGNDAVQADAQDGADIGNANNANMATPPDGFPPRMQMFVFDGPTPDRDGDFDAEIVIHEYIHGLSNRRVGGGVGLSALQSRGMGEGWSDFYALAMLSEPGDDVDGNYAAGGYATFQFFGLLQNYYFGIRRYPYSTDLTKNPLTFKDIDPSQASTHPGIPISPLFGGSPADEVHNQGEVWCVALWEVRANLVRRLGAAAGNQLALQLVTDGMNLSPANPNFVQARDAILQADVVNTGGVNLGDLWLGFAKRGLGANATSPSSVTTAGVVESFALPDSILLRLTLPAGVTEGAGVLMGQGQASLFATTTSNVLIHLSSSDTTEALVPASVVVLAGQTNITFDITILDDALLDGSQAVTITALAPGYAGASSILRVHDNESATLSVNVPAGASEGDPAVQGTVTVSAAPAKAVAVNLISSDPTEATVPAAVTILAGQTSIPFTLTIVDDAAIDGVQSATITAHVENWTDGADDITVADNETTALAVALPTSASEADGVLPNAGRVSITGTLPTNLVVSLMSSDLTELTVPASVILNAGQTFVDFDLTIVDDPDVDGMQLATVTATAGAFTSGLASMTVLDDESPPVPHSPRPAHLATDVPAYTNLSWGSGGPMELVVNGGFELGNFAGWIRADTGGGTFVINNGTFDPASLDGPLPPFAGSYSVLTDQTGPGQHVLYQDVAIPPGGGAVTLRWADRIRNHAGTFDPVQQYYRAEVRTTANTVLAVAYATQPGDPALNNWAQRTFDLTAYRGQTVRIAFIEEDNLGFFNLHIDNVSVEAAGGSSGIITNDVYFGTNPVPGPAELLGSTTNTTWDLPLLAPLTTYYWQIVARRVGTTPGPVWQFTTRGVDHFEWSVIPTPQRVDAPFNVTITAKDEFNTTVSNFIGPVEIRGVIGGSSVSSSNLLIQTGSPIGLSVRRILDELGRPYDFVLTETFSGLSLSNYGTVILGMDGGAVEYTDMAQLAAAVHEGTRLILLGGSEYQPFAVGLNNFFIQVDTNNYFWTTVSGSPDLSLTAPGHPLAAGLPPTYDYVNNDATYYMARVNDSSAVTVATNGDGFVCLTTKSIGDGVMVMFTSSAAEGFWQIPADSNVLRTVIANALQWTDSSGSLPVLISPTNSGAFVNGSWTGAVTVHQLATNMSLIARDAEGHRGQSNPFDVTVDNDIGLVILDAPDPTVIGARLTNIITVGNSGPLPATGVTLTNPLPAGLGFVSAMPSQGVCGHAAGVVTCLLDTIAGGASATVTIVTIPTVGGMLTNPVAIGRAEADGVPGNNSSFSITTVGVPTLAIVSAMLTNENCMPANGAVDPGETVTMNVTLRNTGVTGATNIVATLLAIEGVIPAGGPQNYGTLPVGATTATRPFSFTAQGDCGDFITLVLALESDTGLLRPLTNIIRLGQGAVVLTQNFDAVTPPALPADWTATSPSGGSFWTTTSTFSDTPFNSAFSPDLGFTSDIQLTSPSFPISQPGTRLSFRHAYNTEPTYDGGQLEIAIGGGGFQDILDAGGSFATNGYTGNIYTGDPAWSGISPNYPAFIPTVATLPPAAAGQNVQLRWRFVSDSSVSGAGWHMDTVSVIGGYTCCDPDGILRLTRVHYTNDCVELTWTSLPGMSYELQYATDLTSTNWMPLGGGIPATGESTSATNKVDGAGQRFYRVRKLP